MPATPPSLREAAETYMNHVERGNHDDPKYANECWELQQLKAALASEPKVERVELANEPWGTYYRGPYNEQYWPGDGWKGYAERPLPTKTKAEVGVEDADPATLKRRRELAERLRKQAEDIGLGGPVFDAKLTHDLREAADLIDELRRSAKGGA